MMSSIRFWVLVAGLVEGAVACNALLDNEPRQLAGFEPGAAGQLAADGGQPPIGGTPGQGGAASGSSSGSDSDSGSDSSGGDDEHDSAGGVGGAPGGAEGGASTCDGCGASDVPADALLWFMSDRGLTLSGDRVSAWVDQSAAHVTAAAASAAAMPKLVQPASGPPLIEFDGADDGLELPEGFSSFKGTTFFAVAQAYAANVCAGILSLSNGNDADDIEFGRHTTNLLYYEVLGDFVEGAANAFEPDRRLLVSITQSSTGAVDLRINGVLNATRKTIGLPKAVVRKRNFLGRDTYTACPQAYKGLLGELILFNRGVNADEYAKIQAYLSAKWSVPVASP
jgi:hypothetical protein